jgi:hypothetical protein
MSGVSEFMGVEAVFLIQTPQFIDFLGLVLCLFLCKLYDGSPRATFAFVMVSITKV